VTERPHEMGVRLALGADRRSLVALMIRQGVSMAAIGAVIGVAVAMALSRSIQGLLFGVTPTDPATFIVVIAMLLGVTTLACYIPARRATGIDPTEALKAE